MQLFIISLIALPSIFILDLVVGIYYGFGFRHYWFFQAEHVLGGFFVAMFFSGLTDSWAVILAGLAAVTLIWESLEYAAAHIPSWSEFMKRKLRLKKVEFSWADSVFDVVCNYAGAALLLYFLK